MPQRFLMLGLLVALTLTPVESARSQIKFSSPSQTVADAIDMKAVVHHVVPDYPFEARRSKIIGSGVVFAEVDFKTGIVTSIRMEKSTGSKILDRAGLDAFRQWRFRPRTTRQFRVPVKFGTW